MLADHTAALIWISDTSKGCVWFNQPWLDFRGPSLAEESGNGWAEGVHPEDFDRCLDTYISHFDRRDRFEMEYRLKRNDGVYRTIWDIGIPFYSAEEFKGYVGSCIDVTERHEAQIALQKLNQELEAMVENRTRELKTSVDELEAFSSTVSHDLRAPLRAIANYSGLLKESLEAKLNADEQQLFTRINSNITRMAELIEDLLVFSQAKRARLHLESVSVNSLLEEAKTQLSAELVDRDIIWEVGDLGQIQADAGLLRQVFVNLLSNAAKFTRARRPALIRITRKNEASLAVFSVADNGTGFEPELSDRLFVPFERLESTHEGTGLGLSIVDRVVTRHGGTVAAEGRPGFGAIFRFTLPR